MGTHSLSIRRGGRGRKVALALVGTATVGVVTIAGVGVASAAPLDLIPGLGSLLGGSGTTEVNEDLAPFRQIDTRPPGTVVVGEEFGAPDGGGTGSLQLTTPDGTAKATAFAPDGATSVSDWVDIAEYSAYRSSDSTANAIQFPSLQLTIDFNGAADGGTSNLTYEPFYNDDIEGVDLDEDQWNRYEAGQQRWCSTRVIPGVFEEGQTQCAADNGVRLLEDIAADLPEGTVVTAFGFNQGSGNPGLISAVDLLVAPDTTYDFELKGDEPVDPVDPVDPDPTDPGKDDDGGKDDGKEHDGKDGYGDDEHGDDAEHDDGKHDDAAYDDEKHDDK